MLELRPDSAHVWLTPVDTIPELRVSELEKLLSPDELERANRFAFPRDRSLFVVAHAQTRRVLSKYRPLSPESWRFRRTAFGRPFISNGGDTDGLFFSLSHTHGMMIASLISSTEHAGIDVEKLDGLGERGGLRRARAWNVRNPGRNAFRAPGISELELALAKEIAVGERARIRFRADLFNAFNRAQYGAPNADISQTNFGVITTTISSYAIGRGTGSARNAVTHWPCSRIGNYPYPRFSQCRTRC